MLDRVLMRLFFIFIAKQILIIFKKYYILSYFSKSEGLTFKRILFLLS